MVQYQLRTSKQYSGDSYFREQDFIQTNPRSTLSHMDPNIPSSATPASQELIQAFPKPHSPCDDAFLANKGSPAGLQGILTADLNCRSILQSAGDTCRWEKGWCSQTAAASTSELWDRLRQWGLQCSGGSEVWVSALSLYTQWWPHSFCYGHCHLRIDSFAYRPVIFWLGF
jgi:hypothetical protein